MDSSGTRPQGGVASEGGQRGGASTRVWARPFTEERQGGVV